MKKIIKLLRVSAASNGRREVDLSDVLLLKDCLWNHPDNAVKVREIITSTLKGLSRLVPVEKEKNIPVYEVDSNGETPLQMAETSNLAPVLLKQYVPYIGRSNAEVVDLFVKIGNPVTKGDSLIMLEINQENMEVVAAYSGIVKDVKVGVGDKVNEGDVIIILESNESYLSSITKKLPAKIGTVVKGFMGSGTEADPLLISSVEDFMDLARADVGEKGYHFRQTADLDFSAISHWPRFDFKGNYDGMGFDLKGKDNDVPLFQVISHSAFYNVKLGKSPIAKNAEKTTLTACQTKFELVLNSISGCTVRYCQAISIANNATDSKLEYCKTTGKPLIQSSITNCDISDCEIRCQGTHSGVAQAIHNSIVERCFVVIF